jgi:hypothetical protein
MKQEFVEVHTSVRKDLGHPENKIKDEQDALDAWLARAAENGKIGQLP